MAAAAVRQITCLFVRFKITLFFTFVRSFGTDTYAIIIFLLQAETLLDGEISVSAAFPFFDVFPFSGIEN